MKLADVYKKYSTSARPNLNVRATQLYLTYLGYAPGPVDGMWGNKTKTALTSFLSGKVQDASDNITPEILDMLRQSTSGTA